MFVLRHKFEWIQHFFRCTWAERTKQCFLLFWCTLDSRSTTTTTTTKSIFTATFWTWGRKKSQYAYEFFFNQPENCVCKSQMDDREPTIVGLAFITIHAYKHTMCFRWLIVICDLLWIAHSVHRASYEVFAPVILKRSIT